MGYRLRLEQSTDEEFYNDENHPEGTRKPLAFDVKDEGCQADGPAMFGGSTPSHHFDKDGDVVYHGRLQATSDGLWPRYTYQQGLRDGYFEGLEKGMEYLTEFMNTRLQPMMITMPCTRAHVVEDAGDRQRRAEAIQRNNAECEECYDESGSLACIRPAHSASQRREESKQGDYAGTKKDFELKPLYVHGHDVDARTCVHVYGPCTSTTVFPCKECTKCGYHTFDDYPQRASEKPRREKTDGR